MYVDSHQHFWKLERSDYTWMSQEYKVGYKDFIPVDITPLINKKIINQTIISQEADTTAETEFTLNIAQETKFVSGKVESLDFEKPLVKDKIDQLCDSPYLKEFWPMFLDIQDKTGLFEIA